MINIEEILKRSRRVLLVDWPNIAVPRQLLQAGFEVFGVSPKGYSRAKLLATGNAGEDEVEFERLEQAPERVDMVHVFRPAEELNKIIESQVEPKGATTLWLQPPIRSEAARVLCTQREIDFVEGVDIVESIQRLGFRRLAAP